MLHDSISALYFDYRAMGGHDPDCPRVGTDLWEVAKFEDRLFSSDAEPRTTTIRLVCTKCGAMYLETWDGTPNTYQATSTADMGYGSAPIQQAGLYLWGGPLMMFTAEMRQRGPWSYYITRGNKRPEKYTDVAGIVGWQETIRGAVRWVGAIGLESAGTCKYNSGDTKFQTRAGAVKWVAAELAKAPAVP